MVARLLTAVILLLTLAAVADAACVVVRRPQAVVVAQAILVPAQFAVQAYGGSYQPQPQQQNDDILRRLVEVLERLEGRLDAPAGGHTAESITKLACAKCHTEGSKPQSDFVLFDKAGAPLELSLGDKRAVRARITSRDPAQVMPPGRPLDSSRQAVLLQALKQ